MKRLVQIAVGLVLLSLVLAGHVAAGDGVTLEGSFVWARDDGDLTGDLTAVMTPDGDAGDQWAVAFHFVWEDESHIYLGTASGSLDEGPLTGAAENDDPDNKASFRFSGNTEKGTFTGTHGYVQEDGNLRDGGTLTLKKAE